MTKMYEYVVLRLTPDKMRGEHVNIGLVIFPPEGKPIVRVVAPISKVRALDRKWNSEKQAQLRAELERMLSFDKLNREDQISMLVRFGFVQAGEPNFFHASLDTLDREIHEAAKQYVLLSRPETKPKRPNLQKELTQRFKQMNILGSTLDDLPNHLVVPNVPIPQYPDLKADFVFKNGVYRVTQTLDYRVSEQAAHQKVTEACTKAIAGREAMKAWGENTQKFALVCVPNEIKKIADSHIELLKANGFNVFNYDNPNDLGRYHTAALTYQ